MTIAGPPVAKISLTSGCCINAWDNSKLGSSIQAIMWSGAPEATAAFSKIWAALTVHFVALGWGDKIIAFRVFKANKILKMAVDVGLVVGIIPAIIPKGSAIFSMP